MHKMLFVSLAVAVALCIDPVPEAQADGIAVPRAAKKAPRAKCRHDRCGLPAICPDGTCASLYGAYGPYGGANYWSRYSAGGWGRRW